MKAIHAVWKNEQTLPTEPAGELAPNDLLGDDPESARRWIAWPDKLEPLEMSLEEEAAWEFARRER